MKRSIWLAVFLVFLAAGAGALDFGLSTIQTPEYSQDGFSYTGTFTPWLSAAVGQRGDLYLSGIMKLQYEAEGFSFTPDAGRLEFFYRPNPRTRLGIGRMRHRDVTGLVYSGLGDGLSGDFTFEKARLSVGAYYTGLLNKENAKIYLSNSDLADTGDGDVYFAPSRVVVSGGMVFPGFPGKGNIFSAGLLGQFDLRGGDDALHTQYLLLNLNSRPGPAFETDIKAVLGLAERPGEKPELSLAAGADFSWHIPGGPSDQLFGGVHFATGKTGPFGAFLPVTTVEESEILGPKLSGLMDFKAGYGLRMGGGFYGEVKGTYFLRTDRVSFSDTGLDPDSESYLLGGEIYGSVTWSPLSDLSLLAGGGAFFPGLGKAYREDEPVRWQASLSLILSL